MCPTVGGEAIVGGGTHGCRPTEIYNFPCRGGGSAPPVFPIQQRMGGRGRTPPLRTTWRYGANGSSRTPTPTHNIGVPCFIGGGVGAPRPTGAGQGGALHTGRRGNRRSAAGGGRSEPVSRKCPDWRPRQWTGIGWHDGEQSPPLTGALLGVRCKRITDCHTSLRTGSQ